MGRIPGPWDWMILLGILVCLATHAQAKSRSFDTIMADAVKAKNVGDMERVVSLLQEAYAVNPAPEILNNLGRIYEEIGRYSDAYNAYKKVADNPAAASDLRSLDSGRMAALRPKVSRAWLNVSTTPTDLRLYVDGQSPVPDADGEIGVGPGFHLLQATTANGQTASIIRAEWTPGRRSPVDFNLTQPDPSSGQLSLEGVPGGVQDLALDQLRVGGLLQMLRTVRLAAGTYGLSGRRSSGAMWSVQLNLKAGQTLRLVDLLKAGPAPDAGGPAVSPTSDDAQAVSSTSGGTSSVALIGGLTTAGLGVVGIGVGIALMADAGATRSDVNAKVLILDVDGNITGITEAEAEKRFADADNNETVGIIAMAIGGAAAAGGLLWWLLDDGGKDEANSVQVSPFAQGLQVSGRF